MKKHEKKSKGKKENPQVFKISHKQQADRFKRPLGWLNRILDALIKILQSHWDAGIPLGPGTKELVRLLEEYKKRAIEDGFRDWFPESGHSFYSFYKLLEGMNIQLDLAKRFANDKERCRVKLAEAEEFKYRIIDKFPDVFNVPFRSWYSLLFDFDEGIDRLDDMVRLGEISQDELKEKLRDLLRRKLRQLMTLEETAWIEGGHGDSEFRHDLENMMTRIRFLIEQIDSGDWDVDDDEDQAKIRRMLRQLRSIKYRAIRRMGEYGETSFLDWYKALYDIDRHIHNAGDLRVGGQLLIEWDPEVVIRIIRQAERAKLRFVDKFPWYLGINLAWFYDRLYNMDVNIDLADRLIFRGHLPEVIRKLRIVQRNKHEIEEMLGTI